MSTCLERSEGMALSNRQYRRFVGFGLAGCLAIAGLASCDGPPRSARAAAAYEEDATPESLPNFTLRWLFGVGMGRKLHFESLQLYYLEPITEQEARATGSFLRRLGIGQRETLAQLRKNSDANPPTYELRIGTPFSRREHIDRETRTVYQMMALAAEGALFDGAPVQVSLCNTLLQPLVILRPRLRAQDGQAPGPAGPGPKNPAADGEPAGAAQASGEALRIPVR
jgi:hypothetical protein